MEVADPYELKSVGLTHLQRYSGLTWTDHNLHDPGIIILEQLCYALADLNYRSSFEMVDLLERPDSLKDQALFSPREILHTRPITANDYRKLILDIEGIRNAWVVPGVLRHPVYFNETHTSLNFDSWKQEDHKPEDQLRVHGILDVLLAFDFDEEGNDLNSNKLIRELNINEIVVVEFPRWDDTEVNWNDLQSIWQSLIAVKLFQGEEEFLYFYQLAEEKQELVKNLVTTVLIPEYQSIIAKAHIIRDKVVQLLHANRNMAQDFGQVRAIKSDDIGFTAEIEVEGDADPEELFSELLLRLNDHVSPPIHFYSLPELLDQQRKVDEIFCGPALAHGFLLDEELPKQLPNLRTSDLINIMMDIPGIRAVKNFSAASYPEGVLFRSAQRWCVRLNPDLNYSPRIAPEYVQVKFFINGMPGILRLDEALGRFKEKQAERANRKYPHRIQTNIKPVSGTFRELDRYYSIQKEFPANFSIGEEGLSTEASVKRRAQAHQLKSYLMVFEQLMANYSSQLSSLPELFSLDGAISQTLFSQLPTDVPNLEELLLRLSDAKDPEAAAKELEIVIRELQESPDRFFRRRNRFLNHLMARFGEDMNAHPLLKGRYENDSRLTEIDNKASLLRNYREISANRNAGFNYLKILQAPEDDVLTDFQKRVYLLAGIKDLKKKKLAGRNGANAEGFHLVEHILLRPQCNDVVEGKIIRDPFLPVFSDSDDDWINDPYSSIISAVVPNWPEKFKDPEYKEYFEKLIHLQAPAHIHVLIHWIDSSEMKAFETALENWSALLPYSFSDKPAYSVALDKMISVMLPWFTRESIEIPEPLIPGDSGPLNDELWEIPGENSSWFQHTDTSILQGTFFGAGTPGVPGKGQLLPMKLPLEGSVELTRIKFIPGNELFAETGFAFDIVSADFYKILYYSHHKKVMVLANVEYGYATAILETEVEDLSGKEIRIEMMDRNGKLSLVQSCPGTIGTEFLVTGPGSVGNNRIGLYIRYTQKSVFTHLEFMDSENRTLIFSRQKTGDE